MSVEEKSDNAQMAEIAISPQVKENPEGIEQKIDRKVAEDSVESKIKDEAKTEEEAGEMKTGGFESKGVLSSLLMLSPVVGKSVSFKEESNLLSDLKDHEKKALFELRSKVEEAMLGNMLFKDKKEQVEELEKEKSSEEKAKEAEKSAQDDDDEKAVVKEEKEEEKPEKENEEEKEKPKPEGEEKEKDDGEEGEKGKIQMGIEEKDKENDTNEDIKLWGVFLLPGNGDEGTNGVLLKFLRAREFRVNEAFEMLRNTLQWRKENNIDSILDEGFNGDLASVAYMNGVDREGHPICYNVYGVLGDDEFYNKMFGTEENREKFLRWRFQLMEKGIQKLDFKPGGVSSLLQINDLKNAPGVSKRELRLATKRAVGLLQDNYPEFVARNIFINVPFWYYAFNALMAPFLTQRTKSKFVFARPARVTETLLKYIAAEEIPVQYGGLKRDNDSDFSIEDAVSEVFVKGGSTENIEIPAPEIGNTIMWDLTVLGWEVNYKEEFVPTDEGSYTIIVSKGRKMGWQEQSIRNSFRNSEPGKVVITIENGSFKKKRVLYRYKTKTSSTS